MFAIGTALFSDGMSPAHVGDRQAYCRFKPASEQRPDPDDEQLVKVSVATSYAVMMMLMPHRLARSTARPFSNALERWSQSRGSPVIEWHATEWQHAHPAILAFGCSEGWQITRVSGHLMVRQAPA
jgi:hypothetical protein